MKPKKIYYNRDDDVIEVSSLHPDDIQPASKEIASCLKGLDIHYMGLFGVIYLERKLSEDDLLMINLSLSEKFKIVSERGGRSSIMQA